MAMTKEEQQAAWNERKKKQKLIESVEAVGLTKGKYEMLKRKGLTDAQIMKRYGLYATKLNNWKRAIRYGEETPAAEPAKLDEDTKSRLSDLKDKLDTLKTSQESQDEPLEDKTATSQRKEDDPISVDSGELQKALQRMTEKAETLETDNERLSGKLDRLNEKNAELAAENDRLYNAKPAEPDLSIVDDLKAEKERFRKAALVATADLDIAQSEIHALTEQVRELERYRADYTAIEQLHRETRARLYTLEEENAALTGTETEHIQLMRRHVQLYDRMQGVYGE